MPFLAGPGTCLVYAMAINLWHIQCKTEGCAASANHNRRGGGQRSSILRPQVSNLELELTACRQRRRTWVMTSIDLSPIQGVLIDIILSIHTSKNRTLAFCFVWNKHVPPDYDLIARAIPEVVQEAVVQAVCVKHTGIATKHFIFLKLEGPPHRHNTYRGQMETSARPQSCSQKSVNLVKSKKQAWPVLSLRRVAHQQIWIHLELLVLSPNQRPHLAKSRTSGAWTRTIQRSTRYGFLMNWMYHSPGLA